MKTTISKVKTKDEIDAKKRLEDFMANIKSNRSATMRKLRSERLKLNGLKGKDIGMPELDKPNKKVRKVQE